MAEQQSIPAAANCTVRRATEQDVPAIVALGLADPAFTVSETIRFYERFELEEWLAVPRDNLLWVLTVEEEVVGFLFCKVMSSHWALLDSFYVRPEWRQCRGSRLLLTALRTELVARGVTYVSTLVTPAATVVCSCLEKLGFRQARPYVWYELCLDD